MSRGTPIWEGIRATLEREIAGGHYPPGGRLPTEAALAARFAVNRHTVRRALTGLAEAGLVHPRRGLGVFVTGRPTDYRLGRRVRFHRNLRDEGQTPEKRVLRLGTRGADAREAAALGLAEGDPVHVWEGVSLADGVPVAVFRSVFPAARLPGLLEGLAATRSVTAALAREGIADYLRHSTRLSAERATAVRALHLHCPEGAPVLRSVAVNVDPEGRPVEYGRTWFAGDRVQLLVEPEPAGRHEPARHEPARHEPGRHETDTGRA